MYSAKFCWGDEVDVSEDDSKVVSDVVAVVDPVIGKQQSVYDSSFGQKQSSAFGPSEKQTQYSIFSPMHKSNNTSNAIKPVHGIHGISASHVPARGSARPASPARGPCPAPAGYLGYVHTNDASPAPARHCMSSAFGPSPARGSARPASPAPAPARGSARPASPASPAPVRHAREASPARGASSSNRVGETYARDESIRRARLPKDVMSSEELLQKIRRRTMTLQQINQRYIAEMSKVGRCSIEDMVSFQQHLTDLSNQIYELTVHNQ